MNHDGLVAVDSEVLGGCLVIQARERELKTRRLSCRDVINGHTVAGEDITLSLTGRRVGHGIGVVVLRVGLGSLSRHAGAECQLVTGRSRRKADRSAVGLGRIRMNHDGLVVGVRREVLGGCLVIQARELELINAGVDVVDCLAAANDCVTFGVACGVEGHGRSVVSLRLDGGSRQTFAENQRVVVARQVNSSYAVNHVRRGNLNISAVDHVVINSRNAAEGEQALTRLDRFRREVVSFGVVFLSPERAECRSLREDGFVIGDCTEGCH